MCKFYGTVSKSYVHQNATAPATKLWTEIKVTRPAISSIAIGPYNQSLRNFVLLTTLKRNKIQNEIETEESSTGNFTIRYNNVLKANLAHHQSN